MTGGQTLSRRKRQQHLQENCAKPHHFPIHETSLGKQRTTNFPELAE